MLAGTTRGPAHPPAARQSEADHGQRRRPDRQCHGVDGGAVGIPGHARRSGADQWAVDGARRHGKQHRGGGRVPGYSPGGGARGHGAYRRRGLSASRALYGAGHLMDAGALDLLFQEMNRVMREGAWALAPLAHTFLGVTVLLALAMTLLQVFFAESLEMLKLSIKLVIGAAIISAAITQWHTSDMAPNGLPDVLGRTAIAAGLRLTSPRITVDEFLHPGRLAQKGPQLTDP